MGKVSDGKARIEVRRDAGKIWSHVRQKWLVETPEEKVRQEYMCVLVNEYGFQPAQIEEEVEVTGRGAGQARADYVIWRTVQDKTDRKSPLIIVECKSDNVTISAFDYAQGDNYARIANAPFFVTHNTRETKYWRVKKDRMPGYIEEIENIPHAEATDKEIAELIERLKVFKEEEFALLLHQCHAVIRNREKKDPVAAFDEIAKVLFIKVWVERELRRKHSRQNLFTADWLDTQLGDNPLDVLFQQTKEFYKKDRIFEDDDRINLRPATGREIVRLLERYNLSDTSEDIKGIAFERFLGRTFRGKIGQFFTPRTIVEFMIRMINPQEGEIICDPASGSGGFLIRFFEIVREAILNEVDKEYQDYKQEIENKSLSKEKQAELLRTKYEELQTNIDPLREGSRVWNLANRCIFGTDANDRMARTSKMNMIMHGDGHGGIHHHDGFLNVDGIFENRFDIVLTNPPFGSKVEPSDVVLDGDVVVSGEEHRQYIEEFGPTYEEAYARALAARGRPIASLFEIPKSEKYNIDTEILFIERCLSLLKPGGRLGIVLPEGIFNNPSLAYVREFCEERAFIKAVVSLPQDTFKSSKTAVKVSLLFLLKFTEEEQERYDTIKEKAHKEIVSRYEKEIAAKTALLKASLKDAKAAHDKELQKSIRNEIKDYEKEMSATVADEERRLLKERFNYPVFLYESEKVGITSTGEEDDNELYPNARVPQDIEKTALELYREFCRDPAPFFV